MNSDLLTALLIAGGFFLFVCGILIDGFVRELIAEERMRKSYARKWDI